MWSAGICMFIFLFNKIPFMGGDNKKETFRQILQKPLPLDSDKMWSRVSPAAQDLLRRLLDKDPTARLDSSEVLDHPWFTGEPLVSPNDSQLISIEDQGSTDESY